jgi:hypothetical protein
MIRVAFVERNKACLAEFGEHHTRVAAEDGIFLRYFDIAYRASDTLPIPDTKAVVNEQMLDRTAAMLRPLLPGIYLRKESVV